MLKNGHLLSFSICWNLQNINSRIYDMVVQGQIILLTCVLFINIARASSNFENEIYIKWQNGKIKKKKKIDIFQCIITGKASLIGTHH